MATSEGTAFVEDLVVVDAAHATRSQATLLVTRKRRAIWAAEQSATDHTDQIREIRGYLKKQEWNLVIDASDCRDRITSS